MQLFLCLVVLSKIRILIRKVVETCNKLVKNFLLAVTAVEKLQELHLEAGLAHMSLLSLQTNITENALHLAFIVSSEVTPQLNNNWLEIIVYVVALIDQLNGMGTLRFD